MPVVKAIFFSCDGGGEDGEHGGDDGGGQNASNDYSDFSDCKVKLNDITVNCLYYQKNEPTSETTAINQLIDSTINLI